jgi:transposase
MRYVGIDLHKHSITLCVVDQQRTVLTRRRFLCADTEGLVAFFTGLRPFRAAVEATASYEWLWLLLEPLAESLVLAHPGKLRVIAESSRKSDRLDAQVLAEFLALGLIPQAYRPTPRQRQHRALVRHRCYLRRRLTSVRNKIRRVVSDYNADRKDLFTAQGLAYLEALPVSPADRFVLGQLTAEWRHHDGQRRAADKALKRFAADAPQAEREARAVLRSMPAVGPVTAEVVLSELGDAGRFRNQKQVAAYAGLAPARRESAGKAKEMGITKAGSPLLRWALVEAAWRLARLSPRWRAIYDKLGKRRGKKKAIVAVARRYLGVMASLLRSGQSYRPAGEPQAAGQVR